MIVFDMDGVLVDVSESYRETIRRTVQHFTGKEITPELIQDYKNSGGWNNDWGLSQKIIHDLGVEVEYSVVVDQFQRYFFGDGISEGLILREKWIPVDGLLDRLAKRYEFAVFTGRLRDEAGITLNRFIPDVKFARIVGDDDVKNSKPAPDGLLMIAAEHPGHKLWYIGDTVDDARAAKAAGIDFIGIADKQNTRYETLYKLLQQENAVAIFDTINELETIL